MIDVTRPGRRRKQQPKPRDLEEIILDWQISDHYGFSNTDSLLAEIIEIVKPIFRQHGFIWDDDAKNFLVVRLREFSQAYGRRFVAYLLDRLPIDGERLTEEGQQAAAYVGTGYCSFERNSASNPERLLLDQDARVTDAIRSRATRRSTGRLEEQPDTEGERNG